MEVSETYYVWHDKYESLVKVEKATGVDRTGYIERYIMTYKLGVETISVEEFKRLNKFPF